MSEASDHRDHRSDRDRDRDRGGGGRRRPRRRDMLPSGRGRKVEREYEPPEVAKPPIILAKPSQEQTLSQVSITKSQDKPVVMVRKDDTSGETTPQLHRHLSQQTLISDSSSQSRLALPPEMIHPVKLVDDNQNWIETGMEMLVDQTDFLVIGVIGGQGVGKSTILSLLAGNSPEDSLRSYIFAPQNRDCQESCVHLTDGIDMFVTGQRVIFLDTQPILSASVLEQFIKNDKKVSTEFTTVENYMEIQALQQTAFLMTVCHIIVVVQDWFTDTSLLRFLQTAEMLKPSTPSTSHDSSPEENADYFPNVVFILNKANRDDFSIQSYGSMQYTLKKAFDTSKLNILEGVTMADGKIIPGLNHKTIDLDVNLFLLPNIDDMKTEDPMSMLLPDYRGYPSFDNLINSLRQQIYYMPREHLTHATLSEKNWFHYAARTWDAVKKSQLMAEYNRLLH
ncbi:protein SMG9 [Mytilus galloprovincialis]|uniref:Protein SMG9 n=1 Tax=Mytilus galloprovincialis TaxID=29158 RepID=A0A8B6D2U9_MYTGA|nr:protein SMG9 [Mytilus galloprovincialis]